MVNALFTAPPRCASVSSSLRGCVVAALQSPCCITTFQIDVCPPVRAPIRAPASRLLRRALHCGGHVSCALSPCTNVFDAEELLEESIRCIRDQVDCVLAVVQSTSNFGETYEGGLQTSLDLKRRGLVDVIAHYRPFSVPPYQNEARKRLLAAELGYKWGFTHFLHVDCDEYYRPEQFDAARRYVEDCGADGSVASIKTYFRQPDWALQGFDDYFVPFIHRYGCEPKPPADGAYPFRCDDTRTIESHNVALLPPDLIVMHHFPCFGCDPTSSEK